MSKADQPRMPNYLDHILYAIVRIKRYTDEMTEAAFLKNELVQDAAIRNFEIIGKAAHNIERYHPDVTTEHHDVPWGVCLRKEISIWFGVDYSTVRRGVNGVQTKA